MSPRALLVFLLVPPERGTFPGRVLALHRHDTEPDVVATPLWLEPLSEG